MLYIYIYYELRIFSRSIPSATLVPLISLPKIPKKSAPMMSNCLLRGTFRVKDGDAKSCSCPAFPTEIVSEKGIWGERDESLPFCFVKSQGYTRATQPEANLKYE